MMPQPMFSEQGVVNTSVIRKLRRCKRTILFLDFDGTLAPIRKTPSLATLPLKTKTLLRQLSKRPDVTLGLVTGRSQSDIMNKVRIKNLLLISNHGFQISTGRSRWTHPKAKSVRQLLAKVARELRHALRSVHNILIENKRYTLTVHLRNIRSPLVPFVKNATARSIRPHEKLLRTTLGKKVIEVRPNVEWSKGHAVMRALGSLPQTRSALIVYMGDDQTDEDAFRLLPRGSLTIVVGKRITSAASYSVRNSSEVARFLEVVNSITTKGFGR